METSLILYPSTCPSRDHARCRPSRLRQTKPHIPPWRRTTKTHAAKAAGGARQLRSFNTPLPPPLGDGNRSARLRSSKLELGRPGLSDRGAGIAAALLDAACDSAADAKDRDVGVVGVEGAGVVLGTCALREEVGEG